MTDSRTASLFFLCFGLIWLVIGVRAVLTRQAVSRSKGGRITRSSGRDAVASGVLSILIGVAALMISIVNLF
jgi:hypothetical protein